MKLKSITFRCSSAQYERLTLAIDSTIADTRTMALSLALEEFLNFAEKEETRALNLFALVAHVDRMSDGPCFSEQA